MENTEEKNAEKAGRPNGWMLLLGVFILTAAITYAVDLTYNNGYSSGLKDGRMEQYEQGQTSGYGLGYQDGWAGAVNQTQVEYMNFTSLDWFKLVDGYSNDNVWYLAFGNDTLFIDYPDTVAEAQPFAMPRETIHERTLNGTWYCTEKVCIVLKAIRMPETGTQEKYLCTEKHFADLRKQFEAAGLTEERIKQELADIQMECAIEAEQGGAGK